MPLSMGAKRFVSVMCNKACSHKSTIIILIVSTSSSVFFHGLLLAIRPAIPTQSLPGEIKTWLGLYAAQPWNNAKLDETALKILTERFISAHLLSKGVSLPWTGDEVPLFHLTLWIDGNLVDNLICNQIQSWIIRQFWFRKYSKMEIKIKNAKL